MIHLQDLSTNLTPFKLSDDLRTIMTSSPSPPTLVLHLPEATQMLMDDRMNRRISEAFRNDVTGQLIIRHINFITTRINQLELDLDLLRSEREEIFNYAANNSSFQRRVTPFIRLYRERLGPYARPLLPSPSSSSSSSHNHSSSPHSSSPRTVEILPQTVTETSTEPSTVSSYHSADDHEPGSPQNPINVDAPVIQFQIPPLPDNIINVNDQRLDTPHPAIGILHRPRSMPALLYCSSCTCNGHTLNQCIWTGPIVCEYCKNIGHTRRQCPVHRQDLTRYDPSYQYCTICQQQGHTQDRCFSLQYPQ